MQLFKQQWQMMGTVIDVSFYSDSKIHAEHIMFQVFTTLKDYEKRFSANTSTSEIATVNENAGKNAVTVSSDVYELIKIGKYHSCQVGSHLNIAIGPLVQLWRIGFKEANLPSESAIQKQLQLVDPNQIERDDTKNKVFLTKKNMKIDLGALAKGYFADKVMQYLTQNGITSAFINLGGNLLVKGDALHHEDGLWRVGIQNPLLERGNNILTLALKNKSIVTSGIYERFFECNGKKYHHIISDKTGHPIETDVASLTILSDLSLDGEIWTTRLFGHDIPRLMGEVAVTNDIEAIVIDKANNIYKSW